MRCSIELVFLTKNIYLNCYIDICILILILNAAKYSPTITPLFEPHTLRHYAYLRDTLPSLVPELSLPGSFNQTVPKPMSASESLGFLRTIVSNLDLSEESFK